MSIASCRLCRAARAGDLHDDTIDAAIGECPVDAGPEAVVERCINIVRTEVAEARVKHYAAGAEMGREVRRHVDRHLAEHEAAHAVVGTILGGKVETVEIELACVCRFARLPVEPSARIMVDLAPRALEAARTGILTAFDRKRFAFWIDATRARDQGGCDECAMADALLRQHPDANEGELFAAYLRIRDDTFRLVRRPATRAAIARVADALIARGHLNGSEVEELTRTG